MVDIRKLMYGIMMDYGNYEDRKVARTEIDGYVVDTAYTSDEGYETAVWYEGGKPMAIVERYADKDQAKVGHEKWVEFCKGHPTEVYTLDWETVVPLV